MKKLIVVIALLTSLSTFAQEKSKFLYMHVSDKSVSLYPFYKIFGSNFDPAVTIGGGIEFFEKGNSTLSQSLQANWYSHKLIGTGINLSTSIGYKYQLPVGVFAEAGIGIGGSSFISSRETFSLNYEGVYETVSPVHFTFAVPIDIGLGYQINKLALYWRYNYMLEGKYTNILPILPTSLFSIGLKYYISEK